MRGKQVDTINHSVSSCLNVIRGRSQRNCTRMETLAVYSGKKGTEEEREEGREEKRGGKGEEREKGSKGMKLVIFP